MHRDMVVLKHLTEKRHLEKQSSQSYQVQLVVVDHLWMELMVAEHMDMVVHDSVDILMMLQMKSRSLSID